MNNTTLSGICGNDPCMNVSKGLCGTCKSISFCSKKCQQDAWAKHKYMCSKTIQVKPSQHGGMGVFAKQSFKIGDELIRDKPLIIHDALYDDSNAVNALFKNCDIAKQQIWTELSDCHSPDNPTPETIYKTNAIPLGATNSGIHITRSGLFARTCRLNHSCTPNARYIWNATLQCELVFAQRPIEKGEEITVNYIDAYLSKQQRQQRLQESFNFTCNCNACEHSTEHQDTRFTTIQTLIDDIPSIGPMNPRRALAMSERVIKLMKQERIDLPYLMVPNYYDAFQMARGIGNHAKMQKYISAALTCAKLSEGPLGDNVQKFNDILNGM